MLLDSWGIIVFLSICVGYVYPFHKRLVSRQSYGTWADADSGFSVEPSDASCAVLAAKLPLSSVLPLFALEMFDV